MPIPIPAPRKMPRATRRFSSSTATLSTPRVSLDHFCGPTTRAHDTSSLPPTSAGRRSSAFTRTGICERLLPVASNQGIRLVCINRRAYPDSTPFSEDEQRIFRSGSDDERKALLRAEGESLALLIDALIVELGLPERVTVLAWSMGNVYLLSLLASIRRLPGEIAQRLRTHVTSFILWGTWPVCLSSPPLSLTPSRRPARRSARLRPPEHLYPLHRRERPPRPARRRLRPMARKLLDARPRTARSVAFERLLVERRTPADNG